MSQIKFEQLNSDWFFGTCYLDVYIFEVKFLQILCNRLIFKSIGYLAWTDFSLIRSAPERIQNMAEDEFIFSKSLAKTNITSPIKENSIVIKIILLKLLNFYFLST